jgi:hypothetical protein
MATAEESLNLPYLGGRLIVTTGTLFFFRSQTWHVEIVLQPNMRYNPARVILTDSSLKRFISDLEASLAKIESLRGHITIGTYKKRISDMVSISLQENGIGKIFFSASSGSFIFTRDINEDGVRKLIPALQAIPQRAAALLQHLQEVESSR